MTPKLLVVGLGEVGVAIGISEGEIVVSRLRCVPLHGVLGGDGVEVVGGLNNVLLDGVVTDSQGSANVASLPGLCKTERDSPLFCDLDVRCGISGAVGLVSR